jgi:(S)-mandelate dehydrogenase
MAMKISDAVNIDDLRRLARRRLPMMVFDFIEGGYLPAHQSTTLFGHSCASPFGIAPTGLAALFHVDCDLILAKAAQKEVTRELPRLVK